MMMREKFVKKKLFIIICKSYQSKERRKNETANKAGKKFCFHTKKVLNKARKMSGVKQARLPQKN